jgi:signal transduction histidine kinase
METFDFALKIRESMNDSLHVASTLNNIAICLRSTNQEDAAIKTYIKSYNIFEDLNDTIGKASSLNNIGLILYDQNNYDSSIAYFYRALDLKKLLSDTLSIANTYGNIGRVLAKKGDFKGAIENLKLGASQFEKLNNSFGRAFIYSNLAQIYLDQNLPNRAHPYIIKSQEITGTQENSAQVLTNIKLLSDYYYQVGNYKESRELLAVYSKKIENLFTDRISNQVAELSFMFDNERLDKERKILEVNLELEKVKLQKVQFRQITLILIAILLLSLLGISLVFMRRFRQKRDEFARVNSELNHLNNHLEKIVENRTPDLLATLKKAQESDKQKSTFLANMSHEVRTPLNGILGFTKLLYDESLSPDNRKQYIDIINRRGRNLLQIINDLINISLLDSGQVEIKNTSFNLNQLMYDLFTIFNSESFSKKNPDVEIKLHLSLSDSRSNIIADPNRIEQIFTNLLDNALKFTTQGSVEFGYYIENSHAIKFFVKDTGQGIAEERRNGIFNRFSKNSQSFPHVSRGTGLGLPICKGLVSLLNGNIWFESKENEGSTFYFTIPYAQSKSDSNAFISRSSISSLSLDFSGKVILIVEDDLISYQFIEALLKGTDAKLIHAKNGEDAIEICKIMPNIDLVVMDMRLPFIDGYEATKEIKAMKPDITVIAQTANVMSDDRAKCLSVGCDDYLSKPLDPDDFLRTIAHYLKKPILR